MDEQEELVVVVYRAGHEVLMRDLPGFAEAAQYPGSGGVTCLEVDAHHDSAEGRPTDLGEPGGGEGAAAADVELSPWDTILRVRQGASRSRARASGRGS